jgi:hypothetical protein
LRTNVAPNILLVGKEGPQPVPDFALVQIIGCLTEQNGAWILTNAIDPSRTRNPDVTSEDLKSFEEKSLGSGTFRLMEALAYNPGPRKSHKVAVKGLLIRQPESRLNVTGLESLAPSCAP